VSSQRAEPQPRALLAVYLRDHFAGATAGVSLVRRCKRANNDNEFGRFLEEIEAEIVADRRALEEIMNRLHVTKSRAKQLLGRGAELVARLKSNGSIVRYSPSSRVVELETLAAGVFTKRSLWLSLRAVVDEYIELDVPQLERLIARATGQYERLIVEHGRAAAIAFGPASTSVAR
jgi:hypothetical protein